MSQPFSFRGVYGPAAFLAFVTLCGLISALLGDGLWDELSWIALATPLAVIAWYYGKSRRALKKADPSK